MGEGETPIDVNFTLYMITISKTCLSGMTCTSSEQLNNYSVSLGHHSSTYFTLYTSTFHPKFMLSLTQLTQGLQAGGGDYISSFHVPRRRPLLPFNFHFLLILVSVECEQEILVYSNLGFEVADFDPCLQ